MGNSGSFAAGSGVACVGTMGAVTHRFNNELPDLSPALWLHSWCRVRGRRVDSQMLSSGASVDGTVLTLQINELLDTASLPAVSTFAVSVAGPPASVSAVPMSGDTVALTLSGAARRGDSVALGYTKPATNPIQDAAGNDNVTLDGNVTTGLFGADAEWERLLAGVMLSQGTGDGAYRSGSDRGEVESTLTGVSPYASLRLNERVSKWCLGGAGSGDLSLRPNGRDAMKSDLSMRMGAFGVDGSGTSGIGLDARADAMWIETKSDRTQGMVASTGDVSRLRLVLEGDRAVSMGADRTLTPTGEIGLRIDASDAETGTGLERGAGAKYAAGPITMEGNIRGLVAREASAYREWGASGAVRVAPDQSGRRPTLSIAPVWGDAGSQTNRPWWARDASELGYPTGRERSHTVAATCRRDDAAHPG